MLGARPWNEYREVCVSLGTALASVGYDTVDVMVGEMVGVENVVEMTEVEDDILGSVKLILWAGYVCVVWF